MKANNFQKLMQKEEKKYNGTQKNLVQSNVWGALVFFRLFGDLMHVFLPCVKDVFIMAAGGQSKKGDLLFKGRSSDPEKQSPEGPEK